MRRAAAKRRIRVGWPHAARRTRFTGCAGAKARLTFSQALSSGSAARLVSASAAALSVFSAWATMLIFIYALLSLCMLCCCAPLRYLLSHEWPRLRQMLYFPLSGQMRWEHRTQRQRTLKRLGGIELALQTADDRTVHAVWVPAPGHEAGAPAVSGPVSAPTGSGGGGGNGASGGGGGRASGESPAFGGPVALLLHANAMVLDDMSDWAQYYLSLGVSVLVVTFWGYPDPEEDYTAVGPDGQPLGADGRYCPSELSLYLDAEAALKYVMQTRRTPRERILVHGLSMGGAAASALAVHHPGLKVTVDQTFSSIQEVSANVGRTLFDQLVTPRVYRQLRPLVRFLAPCLLFFATRLVVRMLFKGGRRHGPSPMRTDRLDNLAKAARIQGDYFIIYAKHDEMMPPHFAPSLLAARYGRRNVELMRDRVIGVPGGHCSFFGDVPALSNQYRKYLTSVGFI